LIFWASLFSRSSLRPRAAPVSRSVLHPIQMD
jgi:hypothetical protein